MKLESVDTVVALTRELSEMREHRDRINRPLDRGFTAHFGWNGGPGVLITDPQLAHEMRALALGHIDDRITRLLGKLGELGVSED